MAVTARRKPPSPVRAAALVVGAGALLVVGGLWALARVGAPAAPTERPPPEGWIGVPTAAAPIPAFTKLTRDHVWDRRKGRLSLTYLPPEQITPEMLGLDALLGRVLARDKPAGYVFTERDLLPRGTRPGLTAGIPPGKRAMRLQAEAVPGLFGLAAGDRFDLVATVPLPAPKAGQGAPAVGGVYGPLLAGRLGAGAGKQARVDVVVQAGVVVVAPQARASASAGQGARAQARPVQEVVVAIDPDEVAALTEALAVGAQLTCLPRSGRADEAEADAPGAALPASAPRAGDGAPPELTVLDRITGEDRALLAVPRATPPAANGRAP